MKRIGSEGPGRRGGFTLVEMIVVITIIGILLALGLSSFETNDAVPLNVASDQFESLARAARERSLAAGRPVLLAFLVDSSDPRSDRRSIHVHIWDDEEEEEESEGDDGLEVEIEGSEDEGWRMVTDPEFFPEGVYLDVERSSGLLSGTFQPRKIGGEAPFLGIVFRPDQYCEEGGARIVFMAGSRKEGGGVERKRSGLSTGFLVSRTGQVTRFETTESGS